MNKITILIVALLLSACEKGIDAPSFIEFGGDTFSYEEKIEIAKEAVSKIGIDKLTKHILTEVSEVNRSQLKNVDVRFVARQNNSDNTLIIRCHIETTASNEANEKLIMACKNKLLLLLQDVEHDRKNT